MLKTKLWLEPRQKALEKLPVYPGEPEMTEFDSGFLCGLLREYKPRKILEVGIAGGGTTTVILQCLSMLKQNCVVHSIDLAENFYLDPSKRSGFLCEETKSKLDLNGIEHHFHLGSLTANLIDRIGDGIDFVILDTTHSFPGELLDFLTLFPYMTKNAVVVLHDVIYNLVARPDLATYATKALLDSVVADKYFMPDEISASATTLPTIAAFRINEDTGKNIVNVFRTTAVVWAYSLEPWQIDSYRNIFIRYYDEECLWLYDSAVKANQVAVEIKRNLDMERVRNEQAQVHQLQIELEQKVQTEKAQGEQLQAAQAQIAQLQAESARLQTELTQRIQMETTPLPALKRLRRMARVFIKGY